jgi:hypothetical protein
MTGEDFVAVGPDRCSIPRQWRFTFAQDIYREAFNCLGMPTIHAKKKQCIGLPALRSNAPMQKGGRGVN